MLSTWLKNIDKIIKAIEREDKSKLRTRNHDNLDKAIYKWFVKVQEEGLPISGQILKEM